MRSLPIHTSVLLTVLLFFCGPMRTQAYQEYQKFIRERSGRPVDCAICHAHPDGPDGAGFGQIGGLNTEEQERLNAARLALDPGQEVHSPILNEFGNHIIGVVGKRRFVELRLKPQELASLLGTESDLDNDGIPDGREYLDGTHPLKASDGSPWSLFLTGFQRNWFDLLMIGLATAVGLYGLNNFFRGFAVRSEDAPAPPPRRRMRSRSGRRKRRRSVPMS